MKTQMIQDIEKAVERASTSIRGASLAGQKGNVYGEEGEYTPQILKAGLNAIFGDIRSLVKSHDKFVRISTIQERRQIQSILTLIAGSLDQKDYPEVASQLDKIKIIIRSYRVRGTPESQEIVEERINKLIGMASRFEEILEKIKSLRSNAEETQISTQSAQQQVTDLLANVDEVNNNHNEIENIHTHVQQRNSEIEQHLASAQQHKTVVESFAKRVAEMQQQIDQQEIETNTYKENLELYTAEHDEKLEEANKLIEEARNALSYTTAEGISAAFSERYNEEKKKGTWSLCWLAVAGIFILSSAAVGYFTIANTESLTVGMAMARIAVMSAMISAAWFCASQFVRYKNTLDDYGYKSILAKSMIAFLDQFKQPEERGHYLQTVLREIHQDPLRKKHEVDTPTARVFGLFGNKTNREGNRPEINTINKDTNG